MIKLDSRDFAQNAHQRLATLRREDPVCEIRFAGRKRAFLVTRYDDVVATLKDSRVVKNPNHPKLDNGKSGNFWLPSAFRPLLKNMLNSDEPDHRRMRNLVHKAFTPGMVSGLEPQIEKITGQLLDRAVSDGGFDLVKSFALPLPVTVIAEMIGIPSEDRPKFFAWSKRVIVSPKPLNMLLAVPPLLSMVEYLGWLAEKRRVAPQDDLISALALAEDENGDRFTQDELIAMLFILLVAGHETTVGLISNGVVALLSNPDQLQMLKGDPTLIDSAVEELLRFDGPLVSGEMSFASEDIEIQGVPIPKGSTIFSGILSANRDAEIFPEADRLDLHRSPNKHLAFGHGIHYCLGAPLARLEAKVAFLALLERCPKLKISSPIDQLEYERVMMLHRLKRLPVSIQ